MAFWEEDLDTYINSNIVTRLFQERKLICQSCIYSTFPCAIWGVESLPTNRSTLVSVHRRCWLSATHQRHMDEMVAVYARCSSQYTDDGICTSNELPPSPLPSPSPKVRWTINLRSQHTACVARSLLSMLFAGIAFRHATFVIQLNEIRWKVSMFIFGALFVFSGFVVATKDRKDGSWRRSDHSEFVYISMFLKLCDSLSVEHWTIFGQLKFFY